MKYYDAKRLAIAALKRVTVDDPQDVADTTVIHKNADGTWSVTDNGEEVRCPTVDDVIRVVCDNLKDF